MLLFFNLYWWILSDGMGFHSLVILILQSNSITVQSPVVRLFLEMGNCSGRQFWSLLTQYGTNCIWTMILRDSCSRIDPHKERVDCQGAGRTSPAWQNIVKSSFLWLVFNFSWTCRNTFAAVHMFVIWAISGCATHTYANAAFLL